MSNRYSEKIKQRREKLKESQSPTADLVPNHWWSPELLPVVTAVTVIAVFIVFILIILAYRFNPINGLLVPLGLGIAALLLAIVWFLPKYYVFSLYHQTGSDFDRVKERLKLEDDSRKTFAQILAGTVFLGGLVFSFNSFLLQQEGQYTDRFSKAITQIGDEKLTVRLGGLYALERIAKDSSKDYSTIMEILAAYIREKSVEQKEQLIEKLKTERKSEAEIAEELKSISSTADIVVAGSIIKRRTEGNDSGDFNFNLTGANFFRVNLTGANLNSANLIDANLKNSNLNGVSFIGANLNGANLEDANLIYANLESAKLLNSNLRGAKFKYANLSNCHNITFEQLSEAIIYESTRLPNYLENRKPELLEASKHNLEEAESRLKETQNNKK